jgi:preprotein translocase subunit YajC
MWFIGMFIVISAVFAFLAWRMDQKHKTSVDMGYHANVDKEIAQTMFGDDRWDRGAGGELRP